MGDKLINEVILTLLQSDKHVNEVLLTLLQSGLVLESGIPVTARWADTVTETMTVTVTVTVTLVVAVIGTVTVTQRMLACVRFVWID